MKHSVGTVTFLAAAFRVASQLPPAPMYDLMLRSYAVAVPAEVTLLKTDGDGRLQVHGASVRVTRLFVINPTPLLGFVA